MNLKTYSQWTTDTTRDGLYSDVPDDEYHSSAGYSQSSLKRVHTNTLAHAKHAKENPKRTAALATGTRFDYLTTQPELFAKKFLVGPDKYVNDKGEAKPTHRGTKHWKKLVADNPNREVIKKAEAAHVIEMHKALEADDTYQMLVTDCEAIAQVSAYGTVNGRLRRGRSDYLAATHIVDLKTTIDASPAGFIRANRNFGYWLQAAWYMHLFAPFLPDLAQFHFCMIEKAAPHLIAWYHLTFGNLQTGQEVMEKCEDKFVEAEISGEWPGYPKGSQLFDLPEYVTKPKAAIEPALEPF